MDLAGSAGGLKIESYQAGRWAAAGGTTPWQQAVRAVFRVPLAGAARATRDWAAILSPEERTRAAAFRFAEDREKFMASRGALRMILASALGDEPDALRFDYGPHGKPTLATPWEGSGLCFNLSHSGDWTLIALSRGGLVGVDVEFHRPDLEFEKLARRFFSDSDCRRLLALAPDETMPGFYRCWTRKEAYIKAVGGGLSIPLRNFDVSLEPNLPAAILATRPDPL